MSPVKCFNRFVYLQAPEQSPPVQNSTWEGWQAVSTGITYTVKSLIFVGKTYMFVDI